MRGAALLPGVTGVLRVRLQRDGVGWAMVETVLYMGNRGAPETTVAQTLESVLGPCEHVPASGEGLDAHSALRRWRVGQVLVSHGWFLEHSARDEWDEQEVRVQRVDRPASWR